MNLSLHGCFLARKIIHPDRLVCSGTHKYDGKWHPEVRDETVLSKCKEEGHRDV